MRWVIFKRFNESKFVNNFMSDLIKEIKSDIPALQLMHDKSFNLVRLRLHSESFDLVCRFTTRTRGIDFDAWDYQIDKRFEIFNMKTHFSDSCSSKKEKHEFMECIAEQAKPHIKEYIIKRLKGGNYNETKKIESN